MTDGRLPTVNWRGYEISRLIVGHNPIKGHSHFLEDMDRQMEEWFRVPKHGIDLLRCCHEQGVNTAQFGRGTFELLSAAHKQEIEENIEIVPNWIATLYADPDGRFGRGRFKPQTVKQELESFKSVPAPLIGYQHFGESTDHAYLTGELGKVRDTIECLRDRDGDRLIGVCTHLPEVVRTVSQEEWPVDFLQTCLYTVYVDRERKEIDRKNERFVDQDREEMLKAIRDTNIPCIVFKVLAANRHCTTPTQVRENLALVLKRIKSTDVVCIGMWQKYHDQVEENSRYVRELLA